MTRNKIFFFLSAVLLLPLLYSYTIKKGGPATVNGDKGQPYKASIQPGAERLEQYLPKLKGKKVAVFANQTSTIGNSHLVDVLKKEGVTIQVIFGPEHGFRGTADAGEKVESGVDKATGIPVVSLYGKKKETIKRRPRRG